MQNLVTHSDAETEQDMLIELCHYPVNAQKLNLTEDMFSYPFYRDIYLILREAGQFEPVSYVETLRSKNYDDLTINTFTEEMITQWIHKSEEWSFKWALMYATKLLDSYKTYMINQLQIELNSEKITADDYYLKIGDIYKLKVVDDVEEDDYESLMEMLLNEQEGMYINNFPRLSALLSLHSTDVLTIAATSGFGKSALALNIFNAFASRSDYKCQYYNLEISNQILHKRLYAIASNINVDDFNKDNANNAEIKNAVKKVSDYDAIIVTGSQTLESVRSKVLNNIDKSKNNIVFIDHIGLLETENKNESKNAYSRTTYCMKQLRNLALDNDITLVIVSQVNRASATEGKIGLHSLKDSGEIENSSTHVLLLNKAEDATGYETDMSVDIDLAKNRNGITGKLENYIFHKEKQIFEELSF